jgi:hypothetical protein
MIDPARDTAAAPSARAARSTRSERRCAYGVPTPSGPSQVSPKPLKTMAME